jgi:glycosyltransferase 2 family protein
LPIEPALSGSRGVHIQKHRRGLGIWLAFVLLLLGIGLLIRRGYTSGFNTALLVACLRRADGAWLLLALVLAWSSYWVRVFRWRVMILPLRPKPSIWHLFWATAVGYTGVILLGRPGELIRPYLIATREQLSFPSQLAAWALERIYDLLFVLLLFGFSVGVVSRRPATQPSRLLDIAEASGFAIGVLCALCLAVLVALHLYSDVLEERFIGAFSFLEQHHQERVARFMKSMVAGLHSSRSVTAILWLVLYSIIEWVVIGLVYLAIFRGFPETAHLGLADAMVLLGLTSLGSIVQIPAVGGGIQVVSVLVLTEIFHLPLESASGIALLIWVINVLSIVPLGVYLAIRDRLSWRKLLQLEKEAELE